MRGFQRRLAEEVEDGLSSFCPKLATSLLELVMARWRGIRDALNDSTAPFRQIYAGYKEDLATFAQKIGNEGSGNQWRARSYPLALA